MIDLLTHPDNIIFSTMLFTALALFVLELVTGGMLDGFLPDLDFPDMDLDMDVEISDFETLEPGVVSTLLGWAGANKVPFSIFIVSFMTSFGITGLFIQNAFHGLSGEYLWGIVAVAPAVIVGFFFTKAFTHLISYVIPKEYNQAITMSSMVGKVATVYTTVSYDREGLVFFSDRYGVGHRARAKSLNDVSFVKDSRVLLANYDKGTRLFTVIKVPDSLL